MAQANQSSQSGVVHKAVGALKNPLKIPRLAQDKVKNARARRLQAAEMLKSKASYSQSGEDLLIQYLCKAIKLTKPTYIDIGAHHPTYLSNTAIFYAAGSRGINVEPDVDLFQEFTKQRPEDKNLNVGVAKKAGELKFHVMNHTSLNTFSASEAQKYVERGDTITEIRIIPVMTIEDILKRYNRGKFPDILTMDVEGMDFELIKSIDFKKTSPTIICVETTTPDEKSYKKVSEIIDFLLKKGYMIYADTFINTIFVKADRWKKLY